MNDASIAGSSSIKVLPLEGARFGAEIIARIENGWGEGMHRVDMQLQLTPGDQS